MVVPVGHVAGSVDVRIAGAQGHVDQHAVVDGQPGGLRQLDRGSDPDPDDDRVGSLRRTVLVQWRLWVRTTDSRAERSGVGLLLCG